MTMSSSPDRNTFQKEGYIKRCEEKGQEPNPDYIGLFKTMAQQDADNLVDPAWQENNLEYDLRTTEWIVDKARASQTYAQHIYAALCNTQWQRRDVMPILQDQWWSCSWRHAGGIVSDICGKGDYIDWYCSGIGEGLGNGDIDGTKGYVPEGTVTTEIESDFLKLGWQWREWPNDKI
jgi:hypothetical protein